MKVEVEVVPIKVEKNSENCNNERTESDCQKSNYVPQRPSIEQQQKYPIKVEEHTAETVGETSSIISSSIGVSNTFQTSTPSEELNVAPSQTQSRKERIWEQFKLIEEEVFHHAGNSVTADPGIAFVDHLLRLQNEGAEQIKDNYGHFLDIYEKNKFIFQSKLLHSYLKCRRELQANYGVYIPNIVRPDINPAVIPPNSKIPTSKLKDIRKKCFKIITDQRNILYKSRCIAFGVALINRTPRVKEGLYWELKSKCHPSKANYQKGSKTLGDVLKKYCFIIGDQNIKHKKRGCKKPDDTLQKMILSIQNPPCIKSLISVYSQSNALRMRLTNRSEMRPRKGSLTTMPVESSMVSKRSIDQVEAVQSQKAKKLKGDEMLTCEDIINISSSSESEEDGPVSKSVKPESASTSTAVDPELKFVDNLIKYKEKDTEELKNDYMRLIEKHSAAGSFHQDSDIDAYLGCREKLQIATGVYIHNVHNPDISQGDVQFFESCCKSMEETPLSETLKWSMMYNVEAALHKSMCIANGLSVMQKDSDLKRLVYQKLTRANKLSNNKSLKMLSTVLETELYDIGRNYWDLRPFHEWCDERDILNEVLAAMKSMLSVKSLTSIYSPLYKLEAVELKTNIDKIPTNFEKPPHAQVNSYRMKLKSSGTAEDLSTEHIRTFSEQIKPEQRKAKKKKLLRVNVTPEEARIIIEHRVLLLENNVNSLKISNKRKERLKIHLDRAGIVQSINSTHLRRQRKKSGKNRKTINLQKLRKMNKGKRHKAQPNGVQTRASATCKGR